MDVDHRKLVEILAQLQQSMGQSSSSRELVAATIDTLMVYTIDHFRHEEEAMRFHDYPEAHAHAQEHAELMARLLAFKERADAGQIASALELMDFLGGYLTTHMLNADKRLGVFLRSRLAA
jgi:methyl-accepting chemotaxis protein/hemerythrin